MKNCAKIRLLWLAAAWLTAVAGEALPWWEGRLTDGNWSLAGVGRYGSHLFPTTRSWSESYGLGLASALTGWGWGGLWVGQGLIRERSRNPGAGLRFDGSSEPAGGGFLSADVMRLPNYDATLMTRFEFNLTGSRGLVSDRIEVASAIERIDSDIRYAWAEYGGVALLRFVRGDFTLLVGAGGFYFTQKERRWDSYVADGDTVESLASKRSFVDRMRPVYTGALVYELPERYLLSAEVAQATDLSFRLGLAQRFHAQDRLAGDVFSRHFRSLKVPPDRMALLPVATGTGYRTIRLEVDVWDPIGPRTPIEPWSTRVSLGLNELLSLGFIGQADRGVWASAWFFPLDSGKRWLGAFPANRYFPRLMVGVENLGSPIENRDGPRFPGEEQSWIVLASERLDDFFTSIPTAGLEVQAGFGSGKYRARKGFPRRLMGLALGCRKTIPLPGRALRVSAEWDRDALNFAVATDLAAGVDLTFGRLGLGSGRPYWLFRGGVGLTLKRFER